MSKSEDIALEIHLNQFYWGLLATVYEKQLTDKTNLLLLWCHYNIVRRGMKIVGLGDYIHRTTQVDYNLPEGWNQSLPCRMLYLLDETLFMLTVLPADDDGDILINLTRASDNKISVTAMNLSEISKIKGRLEEVIPNWIDIQERLNKELIDPLIKNAAKKDVPESACPSLPPSSPHGLPKPKSLPRPRSIEFVLDPPLGVGSSDLNPLGGSRGILFQPPRTELGPSFTPDPICSSPGHSYARSRGRSRGVMQSDGRPGPIGNYPVPDHRPPSGYDDMF